MSLRGENGRYSPVNMTSSLNDMSSYKEELSLAQRLNLQVIKVPMLVSSGRRCSCSRDD